MSHSDDSCATFADRVRAIPGGEHLEMCYSCGTCVSVCPVQQKVNPDYNPRRLIRKSVFDLADEALEDVTTWLCTSCDLCYPACPQEIHISGVIGAVRELAIESGCTSPLRVALVNEQTCVACGLCVEVCPYEAVRLVDAAVPGRGTSVIVARVDPNRCMACGLCAASCRSTSIGLPEEFSDEELVGSLWEWMRQPVGEVAG
jgi:heterodisulfide reductase subunit C